MWKNGLYSLCYNKAICCQSREITTWRVEGYPFSHTHFGRTKCCTLPSINPHGNRRWAIMSKMNFFFLHNIGIIYTKSKLNQLWIKLYNVFVFCIWRLHNTNTFFSLSFGQEVTAHKAATAFSSLAIRDRWKNQCLNKLNEVPLHIYITMKDNRGINLT